MHGAGRPHRASGRWGVLGFWPGSGGVASWSRRCRESTGGLGRLRRARCWARRQMQRGRAGGTGCPAPDRGLCVLGPTPAALPRRECSCAAARDVLVGRRIEWLVGMLDPTTGCPRRAGEGAGARTIGEVARVARAPRNEVRGRLTGLFG